MYHETDDQKETKSVETKVCWDLDTKEDVYAEDLNTAEHSSGMRIWANLLILLLVVAAMIIKSLIG